MLEVSVSAAITGVRKEISKISSIVIAFICLLIK